MKITEELLAALRDNNPNLTSLDLNRFEIDKDNVAILSEALKTNQTVTTIDFSRNRIGAEGIKALAHVLKLNRTVYTANFEDSGIGQEGAVTLIDMLQTNCTIKVLNIGNNSGGGGIELGKALACMLRVNQTLQELELGYAHLGKEGAKYLAEGLCNNQSLKKLNIWENNIYGEGAMAIAKALYINQSLRELNLDYNDISVPGFIAFIEMLKVNKSLTTINLGHSWTRDAADNLREEAAKAVAEMLKVNHSLTELQLPSSGFTAEDIAPVADALKINKGLRTFNLFYNKVGDEGAGFLADVLKINKTLTNIHLTGNEITDEGVEALALVLTKNHTLRRLCLTCNELTPISVKNVITALQSNHVVTAIDGISLHSYELSKLVERNLQLTQQACQQWFEIVFMFACFSKLTGHMAAPLANLPEKVLRHILSYVPIYNIGKEASQTLRMINYLYEHIHSTETQEGIYQKLKQGNSFRIIENKSMQQFRLEFFKPIVKNTIPETLSRKRTRQRNDLVTELINDLIGKLENLRSLEEDAAQKLDESSQESNNEGPTLNDLREKKEAKLEKINRFLAQAIDDYQAIPEYLDISEAIEKLNKLKDNLDNGEEANIGLAININ